MTEPPPKQRQSLGSRILIGVLAGLGVGLVFGDLASPLGTVGEIYVGLLQMTVLPYVIVSLFTRIGRLSGSEARRLMGRAGVVMLFLWAVALAVIAVLPLGLPEWDARGFFSSSLVEDSEPFDFLELYLPINPFYSLANNIVPAAVLFSILLGVATIRLPFKERLLDPAEVLGDALTALANFVIGLSPWGTFALSAGAAGTLRLDELIRIEGYLLLFTFGALALAFIALPGVVAALTPFRYKKLVAGLRETGLTAFATGKLFAVLPMVIDGAKRELARHGAPEDKSPGVYVPLAYSFPQSGKLLGLLFLPFAAWVAGAPLSAGDMPALLGIGVLALFGSPLAAIPFLLDTLHLPLDLFPLFLMAGVWTSRVGDVVGASHLSSFTLLCAAWGRGWVRLNPTRLALVALALVAFLTASILGTRALVTSSVAELEPPGSLVEGMTLSTRFVESAVEPVASPNPARLRDGQTYVERIREQGLLRVGYRPDTAPFCYVNRYGDLVGLDVDFIQLFASELGADLVFVPFEWGELDRGFADDHFDIAVGGLPSSMEALDRYHESVSYLDLHIAFVTADYRIDEFQTLDQLRAHAAELRIGVVSKGHLARISAHRFPGLEFVQLSSQNAFVEGEEAVDALLTTAEAGAILSMRHPDFAVVVPARARARIPTVMALAPEAADLLPLLDRWIGLMKSLGTIDDLHAKWILGEQDERQQHRWSVVRDVFGWSW